MKLAFIGTGLMGRPMAERLLAAGHSLAVYNRTREKALPLAEQGAEIADTPGEAVAAADGILLMVTDAVAIRDLLYSEGGLPDLAGKTFLQMSTIASEDSRQLAADVERAGGEYLEAPVLGSTPQASEGKLLVLVGATPALFARWGEVLRCFGPEPRLVGDVGKAASLKLAFNQLIASLATSFSLSLGLVRRSGLDVEEFMEILRLSTFFAPTFDQKLPRMLERNFSDPHFPARHLLKDVDLVRREAEPLGLDTSALEGVREVVAKAVEKGLGDGDYCGVYGAVDPA